MDTSNMDTGSNLVSDSAALEPSSRDQSINLDINAGSSIDSTDFESLTQDKSTSTTDLPTTDEDSLCDEISHFVVDAVHPLFTEVFGTRRKRNVGTSTTEDRCQLYFCVECDMFVHKTMLDITNHFITRKHVPRLACVYCEGAVFTYLDNRTVQYHHKCDNISPSNCDQLDRCRPLFDDDVQDGKGMSQFHSI
ncbi:hypothetical protein LSTR_LSTR007153 [Laodelphax striatellus]|uniref:Uncharacterized protein n=1 Tax=Laodelphax striatellus TaxID=195883 RepID=A0A482WX98_LAOST|nr:hypothetical protein LSTR_LSTR007153 [Laodelphax striatellus]